MSGALIQLVANKMKPYDYSINENGISFFKIIYKRYTNFIIEPKEQLFGNNIDFGNQVSCTLSKNGDAVSQIYIVIKLPEIPTFNNDSFNNDLVRIAWVKNIGYAIINNVEIEIGGIIYDRHDFNWLNIQSELTITNNLKKMHDIMIGNLPCIYELSNSKKSYELYIPLQFWFCKKYYMCLPLVSLNYVDIKINVEFNHINNILIIGPTHYIQIEEVIISFEEGEIIYQIQSDGTYIYGKYINNKIDIDTNISYFYYIKQHDNLSFILPNNDINTSNFKIYNLKGYYVTPLNNTKELYYNNQFKSYLNNLSINYAYLITNYIYFDDYEREKFKKNKLEYVIETVQYNTDIFVNSSTKTLKLNYNYICKELVFVSQLNYIANGYLNDLFNYSNSIINGINLIKYAQLNLDGIECVSNREIEYFNMIQIYQNHSNAPKDNLINCYSFSLYPENIIPTGTINFLKFQNVNLKLEMNKIVSYNNQAIVKIYAITYNVIQINNGLINLLF